MGGRQAESSRPSGGRRPVLDRRPGVNHRCPLPPGGRAVVAAATARPPHASTINRVRTYRSGVSPAAAVAAAQSNSTTRALSVPGCSLAPAPSEECCWPLLLFVTSWAVGFCSGRFSFALFLSLFFMSGCASCLPLKTLSFPCDKVPSDTTVPPLVFP